MKLPHLVELLFSITLVLCMCSGATAQVGEVSDEGPTPALSSTKEPENQPEEPLQEAGGPLIGLQASTNFQEMLAGLKIQMNNVAVTPKFGFFIQSLNESEGSVFNIGLGLGFDYLFREGNKLRPYVGGDFLVYVPHKPDDTDIWFLISPHMGAEYWLVDSFSVGGNLGVQFGIGDSFYTPNTIGVVESSDFSFGINGVLSLTYYF